MSVLDFIKNMLDLDMSSVQAEAEERYATKKEREENTKESRFDKLRLDAARRTKSVSNVNSIYYAPPWSLTKGEDGNKGSYSNLTGTSYKVLYIAHDTKLYKGFEKSEPKSTFVFPLPPEILDTVNTEWDNSGNMLKRVVASGGKVPAKLMQELTSQMQKIQDTWSRHTVHFQHDDFFFKSVGLRDFTFRHKMTPQSRDESEMMKIIVDRIQMYSLPTFTKATTLARPSDWEIHFLDGDKGINDFLPKINRCILETVMVNNTPNESFQPSNNSNPNDIEIELTFKEQVIRTREDYAGEMNIDEPSRIKLELPPLRGSR